MIEMDVAISTELGGIIVVRDVCIVAADTLCGHGAIPAI